MITFHPIHAQQEPEQKPGKYLENDGKTIVWTMATERVQVSPELTLQDRRELAKTGLTDDVYFVKAKRVYAAGGKKKAIQKACGRSPSYAAKVYAAFNRAKANMNKK